MSGNQSPSTASTESNTSDKTTFIGNINAAEHDSQNGKENSINMKETEKKIRGLKHQDKKVSEKRSSKDKAEEKESPKKKQKLSRSTTTSGSQEKEADKKKDYTKQASDAPLRELLQQTRITRLEAEVAQLKSELDELKAKMAKIASLADDARG